MRCHALVPLLMLAGIAPAQSLSIALPTPATLNAQAGGNVQTLTLPAGPVAAFGSVQAHAGPVAATATAELFWYSYSDAYSCYFRTLAMCSVPAGPGQASVGTSAFVVSLSNPTPIYVALDLGRDGFGPAGGVQSTTRIDVDDDGTFELTEQMPSQPVVVFRLIGPTPVLVRCVVDAAASAPLGGSADVLTEVNFTMRRGDTSVSVAWPGCSGAAYGVSPRLDGNLDYAIDNLFAGASVAVFGLGVQPLFLGVSTPQFGSPPLPCVLMPRPDLVVFLPTAATQQLVIPPAARPLALYTQAVSILPSGFVTSSAVQVYAY